MIDPNDEELKRVYRNDPIVWRVLGSGGTLRDCVIALSRHNRQLADDLNKAEIMAPRKVRAIDGTVYVYHYPDHLIPDPEPHPLSWFGRPL